jgi:Ca-activated chloride channel family protein
MKLHWLGRVLTVCGLTALLSSPSLAKQVALDVSLAQPTLLADQKQTTYLKVGLTGFELESETARPPINVVLVLDKSGSMSGDKIQRAKEAAISALERLRPDDIVSIVTYDTVVSVIVPATKLTDRQQVIERVREIEAAGSTALFAGVSKGADELRKFLDKERINRVILLSDGLANVGPQSPSELGELGKSLAKEGIVVSTIGLGLDYNEDLMTRLARESDGNHVFVEKSTELVEVFNREFNEAMSVVAQEVVVKIQCRDGVRPVRMLNTDAEINGSEVYVKLNQLYSRQEKYLILEVELPAKGNGTSMQVADVSVSYTNMETKTEDRLSSLVGVRFTSSSDEVATDTNTKVMEECVLQIARLENEAATALRDKGDIEGARRLLELNCRFLEKSASSLNAPGLLERAADNARQAQWVESDVEWKRGRKLMRALQYSDATQQSINPAPSSSESPAPEPAPKR